MTMYVYLHLTHVSTEVAIFVLLSSGKCNRWAMPRKMIWFVFRERTKVLEKVYDSNIYINCIHIHSVELSYQGLEEYAEALM